MAYGGAEFSASIREASSARVVVSLWKGGRGGKMVAALAVGDPWKEEDDGTATPLVRMREVVEKAFLQAGEGLPDGWERPFREFEEAVAGAIRDRRLRHLAAEMLRAGTEDEAMSAIRTEAARSVMEK